MYQEFFAKYPYPEVDCSGKTIVVTGSNIGIGKEAVRHFVRLGAAKVIIAVRSIRKGEEAKTDIEASTKRIGVLEVWELDLCSYDSVKAFAARLAELPRVDAVVANASVALTKFSMAEDNETTLTVNVISTFLLVLLILPKMRESAGKWKTVPTITIVGSNIHSWINFRDESPNILAQLNNENTAVMSERYQLSKLFQVFAFREIAERLIKKQSKVIINQISPGLAKTALTRNATGAQGLFLTIFYFLLARTAEESSRTLVHAATAGPESQGRYFSNCDINLVTLSKYVMSDEGLKTQRKVWAELATKLEAIQPGIMKNI